MALSSLARRKMGRTGTRGNSTASVQQSSAAPSISGSLARFLLFGFIGGFILNLMPCVLPVISLKIFGFIQHAGQDRRRILRSGLAFVAGIFAWFIGLALLLIGLKTAGREITWAFQFTNPYFVLLMSAIVLVFALNLFGVFEISLPQFASRRVLGMSAKEGDAGSFFQGVFATVLATPCTAPFLGHRAWVRFHPIGLDDSAHVRRDRGRNGLALFVAFGPTRVAASACPSRAHGWCSVKQLMGFLLLATLVFLLAVLGAERGSEAIIWSSCFLLALSLACWMKGAFITPIASARARFISVVLMLALVLGSGWYFIGRKFAESKVASSESSASAGDWQPLHSAAPRIGAQARSRRLRRFHRGLVPHVQIQRGECSRSERGARSFSASRRHQDQGRLD